VDAQPASRWTISAYPVRGQAVERCVVGDAVEESILTASLPSALSVWLRRGVSREVADGIVACLRSLPGEPLTVTLAQVDEDGTLLDEFGTPVPLPPEPPRIRGRRPPTS